MRLYTSVFILLTLSVLLTVAQLDELNRVKRRMYAMCPPKFQRIGSECYAISDQRMNWLEAHFQCKDKNSKLAEPNKNADRKLRSFFAKMDHDPDDIWIGATYDWHSKLWQWSISGKNLTYDAFSQIDPESRKNLEYHCAVFSPSLKYRWSARSCVDKHRYICQHKMPKVSEKNRNKVYARWNQTFPDQLANEVILEVIDTKGKDGRRIHRRVKPIDSGENYLIRSPNQLRRQRPVRLPESYNNDISVNFIPNERTNKINRASQYYPTSTPAPLPIVMQFIPQDLSTSTGPADVQAAQAYPDVITARSEAPPRASPANNETVEKPNRRPPGQGRRIRNKFDQLAAKKRREERERRRAARKQQREQIQRAKEEEERRKQQQQAEEERKKQQQQAEEERRKQQQAEEERRKQKQAELEELKQKQAEEDRLLKEQEQANQAKREKLEVQRALAEKEQQRKDAEMKEEEEQRAEEEERTRKQRLHEENRLRLEHEAKVKEQENERERKLEEERRFSEENLRRAQEEERQRQEELKRLQEEDEKRLELQRVQIERKREEEELARLEEENKKRLAAQKAREEEIRRREEELARQEAEEKRLEEELKIREEQDRQLLQEQAAREAEEKRQKEEMERRDREYQDQLRREKEEKLKRKIEEEAKQLEAEEERKRKERAQKYVERISRLSPEARQIFLKARQNRKKNKNANNEVTIPDRK